MQLSTPGQRPRGRLAAVALLAALAALAAVGLVLQARSAGLPRASALLASTAAEVSEDLREAEDAARMSIHAGDLLGRDSADGAERGTRATRAASGASAAQAALAPLAASALLAELQSAGGPGRSAQPLEEEVTRAAAAERRAMRQERKAEAGLAAERSLVKAFRAARHVNQVRLNAALSALGMASEDGSADGLASALALAAPADTAASTGSDSVSEDQALRASIASLYAHAVPAPPQARGAIARAKKLAAAKQKKKQPASDTVASELAAVRREMESLKHELVKAPSAPAHPKAKQPAAAKMAEELAAVQKEIGSFKRELAQVLCSLMLPRASVPAHPFAVARPARVLDLRKTTLPCCSRGAPRLPPLAVIARVQAPGRRGGLTRICATDAQLASSAAPGAARDVWLAARRFGALQLVGVAEQQHQGQSALPAPVCVGEWSMQEFSSWAQRN